MPHWSPIYLTSRSSFPQDNVFESAKSKSKSSDSLNAVIPSPLALFLFFPFIFFFFFSFSLTRSIVCIPRFVCRSHVVCPMHTHVHVRAIPIHIYANGRYGSRRWKWVARCKGRGTNISLRGFEDRRRSGEVRCRGYVSIWRACIESRMPRPFRVPGVALRRHGNRPHQAKSPKIFRRSPVHWLALVFLCLSSSDSLSGDYLSIFLQLVFADTVLHSIVPR